MKVGNHEDALRTTQVDASLEPLEALLLPHTRLVIRLKVAVVERDPDRVQTELWRVAQTDRNRKEAVSLDMQDV